MTGDVLNEVRSVAADVLAVDVKTLTGASCPEQVEGWDSVQHLNLVLALESKYEIQFAPEEMERMQDLAAIAALVRNKIT